MLIKKSLYLAVMAMVLYLPQIASTSNCPIIFIHGQKGALDVWPYRNEAKPIYAWPDWNGAGYGMPYRTAMDKILAEHYGGYSAGSPLDCDKNSTLTPTGGNTKKIYNFSYYNPDGSKGVIGSNGYCLPVDYRDWRNKYEDALANASWAQHLAEFIDKVLTATGAQKVDIVAHSMGGLVVRAAIKWYGCASKVRKLLLVATPNKGCHYKGDANLIQQICYAHADWQIHGEDLEMNVDPSYFMSDVLFEDNNGNKKIWCEFLDPNNDYGVSTATISGDRLGAKDWILRPTIGKNDNMISPSWVKMNCAQYNPTVHASHGVGDYRASDETFLQGCTYTTEFIKNWIIDDDISHNGATYTENCYVFPSPWYDYELRFWAPISDYSKALAMTAVLTPVDLGQTYEETYKGYGIYKYSRNLPGTPVFATNPAEFSAGEYKLYYRVYDMNGLVVARPSPNKLINTGDNIPANVMIIVPNGSESYSNGVCQIKWRRGFGYAITQKIYLTINDGGSWILIGTVAGGDSIFAWHIPGGINSNQCRIKVVSYLDVGTTISDVSDNCFTINTLQPPYDLYAFTVDENKVGLDWRCGTLLGFEVQRKKAGENWQVIATGYWGPGSKTFYDETVTVSLSALPNAFF